MKKKLLFILSLFFAFAINLFSQNQEIRDKSLVITNPLQYPYGVNINLEASDTPRWAREFNFSFNGKGDIFSFGALANGVNLEYGYISGNRLDNLTANYANPWMVFLPTGKIGIGTKSPQYLLDINGITSTNSLVIGKKIANEAGGINRIAIIPYLHTDGPWHIYSRDTQSDAYLDLNYGVNKNLLTIQHRGYIGLGVAQPKSELDVNGTIRAKEVKIEATGWSDFVFADNYKLPTLYEVETHIKEHKHLPDIPSEKEVLEEGVNVVEMQAKLLQKIEELTLYVIDLKKENEMIIQANQKIKEELTNLKNE